jgi:hypothetical protein
MIGPLSVLGNDNHAPRGAGCTALINSHLCRLRLSYSIPDGADPHRLLLLTFTRRAALEMTRRAPQILAEARSDRADRASPQTAILPWSGTLSRGGRCDARCETAPPAGGARCLPPRPVPLFRHSLASCAVSSLIDASAGGAIFFANQLPAPIRVGVRLTRCWREVDSNFWFRAR